MLWPETARPVANKHGAQLRMGSGYGGHLLGDLWKQHPEYLQVLQLGMEVAEVEKRWRCGIVGKGRFVGVQRKQQLLHDRRGLVRMSHRRPRVMAARLSSAAQHRLAPAL